MIDRSDKFWYRDALIYQIHVKSFFDSNDDGIGNFDGVTKKLDYVKELGVTAIWLMPFYPSPLRDDGYDISDYRGVNSAYGSMRDFKNFVRAAHDRGLRVITELIINHTSDQHPWFQKARTAKPGSSARDFYVWSDTDQRYTDARIIFVDTETSNWTWDPVANAFYWHRFYSHQPDLNFDNPRVLEAVLNVMRFWLDAGVDGLRLDAVPYLIEREGTNCENLSETHDVIRKIRAAVDADYPDRMLLAEANQWPEETAHYFGSGDECHMAFHFPLMPRMYMAIAQEDRHPITDIMRQTPEIPEGCQWAIFLRNHDELTLEMVTDTERDYLWTFYASDRRARINLGIRRRLAPLLENDRRKIELLNSLLLSMPGTPVLYYGDEIGMGDNIYLGDRDAVRTPMQWSPDRNGGFSKADPAQLFLPTIQDAIYGFQAVNVEAQLRSPASLLNWVKRMIAVRRGHRALGRGNLRFIYPENRKVLAYVRELDDERILCVANTSRAPQSVELDLSEMKGSIPIEMTGGAAFPPVGDLPYLLTLPSYGFFWLNLTQASAEQQRFGPSPPPELFTLVRTGALDTLLRGREGATFERMIPHFIKGRRWFAGKNARISAAKVLDYAVAHGQAGLDAFLLPLVSVEQEGRESKVYFTPLAIEPEENEALVPHAVARVRTHARMALLVDAAASADFAISMVDKMRAGTRLAAASGGSMAFQATPLMPADMTFEASQVRRLSAEQSNSSIVLADEMILKLLRGSRVGVHPEVEICRFLREVAGFQNVPPIFGYAEYTSSAGDATMLAILQGFERNQGDGWTLALDALKRDLDTIAIMPESQDATAASPIANYLIRAEHLGRRTAELHVALATPTEDPDFGAEELTIDDVRKTVEDARILAERAFEAIGAVLPTASAKTREAINDLLEKRDACFAAIEDAAAIPIGAMKTRIHGDYHLGQVLVVKSDYQFIDFEGEPGRDLRARRAKDSPLRDVAGMLRSFSYATETSARDVIFRLVAEAAPRVEAAAADWLASIETAFLSGYEGAARDSAIWIEDEATRKNLLRLYLLQKAFYEIHYEANNRPDWIGAPVHGVLSILQNGLS